VVKLPSSSLHAIVCGLPVTVKLKLALDWLVRPFGPPVTVATGGVESTLQLLVSVAEWPAGSVARTVNVCEPSARPV
jgi:hypothetical protein